jgi:peptidyl-prolyl cis-trans isomerase C
VANRIGASPSRRKEKKMRLFGRTLLLVFLVMLLVWVPRIFPESETILAKVGDIVITQDDLKELMGKFAAYRKDKPYSPEDKKMLLDNLVKGVLIGEEAKKEKLDQTPAVKAKLKIYRNDLLIQEYVNKKIKPLATVTDKEIEDKMKGNPNLIPRETLTLREIVVKTENEAQSIYQELKKGADFSKMAIEKSVAQTKINGGHRKQPVSKGQLPKVLEEVAFNLKKGEFSKPVKTEDGYYYILSLVERKEKSPEEIKKLEITIKEKIRQMEMYYDKIE